MSSISKKILLLFSVFLATYLSCDSSIFKSSEPPVIERIGTENDIYKFNPGDTVTVIVVARDPNEGSLFYSWSANSGELLLPRDRDRVKWIAPTTGGNHTIDVTVSNSDDKSVTDDVTIEVISPAAPLVEILSPDEGEFLIQFTEITIQASAFHENGLQSVSLFVNDTLKITQPYHQGNNIYDFDYTLNLPGGANTFMIKAIAKNTGAIGSDEVTVSIEVILPKK